MGRAEVDADAYEGVVVMSSPAVAAAIMSGAAEPVPGTWGGRASVENDTGASGAGCAAAEVGAALGLAHGTRNME